MCNHVRSKTAVVGNGSMVSFYCFSFHLLGMSRDKEGRQVLRDRSSRGHKLGSLLYTVTVHRVVMSQACASEWEAQNDCSGA